MGDVIYLTSYYATVHEGVQYGYDQVVWKDDSGWHWEWNCIGELGGDDHPDHDTNLFDHALYNSQGNDYVQFRCNRADGNGVVWARSGTSQDPAQNIARLNQGYSLTSLKLFLNSVYEYWSVIGLAMSATTTAWASLYYSHSYSGNSAANPYSGVWKFNTSTKAESEVYTFNDVIKLTRIAH